MTSTNIPQLTLFLESLGLSETERQLYLSGLTVTEASVSWLVQQTGINRTTAYHALETLRQKGFLTESKTNGRLVYKMVPAKDLKHVLELRKAQIETQKHTLLELEHFFPGQSTNAASTSLEKFEGVEGIKQAIEKALYCKSRQWNIIAPAHNFFAEAGKDYADYFMKTRRNHDIRSRTLWETGSTKSADISLQDLLMRKPRYLPPQFSGQFKSVVIIFDDKALFIPPLAEQTAVLLHSAEIISTLNVLFEALWLTAQKPSAK